jgi:hypothetical protein
LFQTLILAGCRKTLRWRNIDCVSNPLPGKCEQLEENYNINSWKTTRMNNPGSVRVNRRQVVAALGAGSFALGGSALLRAAEPTDVIVLGAGLADRAGQPTHRSVQP